jgi:acetyl esterase/lipase
MERSRLRRRAAALRAAACLLAVTATAALAGCGTAGAAPTATSTPGVAVAHDLDFARPDGAQLKLDACTPKRATGKLPAVVIVHSGGWTEGSHGDLDWLCEEGARHGFAAFTVDYRFLPAAFPSQLEDVVSAVDWISAKAQADRFHVDPKRVALLGTSAGGTIVAELLTGVPGSPVPSSRFVGGAVLSGIHDFTALPAEAQGNTAAVETTLGYSGCSSLDCARLATVSPIKHLDRKDPPMFLANSTDELVPLPQATRMDEALKAAGVRHELRIAEGKDHAEFIVLNHRDIDAAMWAFLTKTAR